MVNTRPIKSMLATLASVYVVQSLIGMFTMQGIPALLRSEGVSTSQVGLFSLVMLPWVFKFLWAPQVEKLRKKGAVYHRHGMLVISAQIVAVFILILIAGLGNISKLWWFFTCVLAMTLVSTLADITADGLAVDEIPKHQRYLGNILQVGGAYVGAVFGGGLFIYVSSLMSWQNAIMALAGIVLLWTLLNYGLLKAPSRQAKATAHKQPSLRKALRRPQVQLGLWLVAVSQLGTRGVLAMMMPFLVDHNIELTHLGLLVAGGGIITGCLGALLGGWITRRISAYSSLCLFLVVEATVCIVFWLYTTQWVPLSVPLEVIYISHSVLAAAKFVALYTLMMEYAYGDQSGVDFSLFQSMDMFVAIMMSIACGALISHFGYGFHFMTLASSSILALVFLARLSPRLANRAQSVSD